MDTAARTNLIEAYAAAPAQIASTLQSMPRDAWQWKATTEGWSIQEVIVHLADSETHAYIRCRRCIAESGTAVIAYDEERWAKHLEYHEQPADEALELFRLLRSLTHHLLKRLPAETWANTIDHPEHGTMTLDDWLHSYYTHGADHLSQIQEMFARWQAHQA